MSDDHERFVNHCEEAAKIVSTWPEWKRNVLGTWSNDMPLKTKPEPGPLVCSKCGKHTITPVNCSYVCECDGTYQYVQYGWLVSVDNGRFEPMDYGEEHVEGIDEPSPNILLIRGSRMAAFDLKEDAEEALKASNRAMKEKGSNVLQRAVFCLVRIIGRDKR